MIDKFIENKADLQTLCADNKEIVCIAVVGSALQIGVIAGSEDAVRRKVDPVLKGLNVEYDVKWEIDVSRYPVMLMRNGIWMF